MVGHCSSFSTIQGAFLLEKIHNLNNPQLLFKRLDAIVPAKSVVPITDVIIYQLDERSGSILKLANTEGIPSDKNYLNQSLRHGNEMFDSLLEIEQDL